MNQQIENEQITKKKSSRAIVVAIIITGIIVIIGAYVFKTSAQLQELKSLSSVIQLTTGREVSRWSQDKAKGLTGPIYAKIRIEFEPINNYTKEEVYAEIVDILKNNNWKGEICVGCSTPSFSASLQKEDYPIPIRSRIRVHSDENLVSISMDHPRP